MRKRMAIVATMAMLALAGCSSGAETTTPRSTASPTALPSRPAAAKSSEPSPTPTIQDVMKLEEFAPLDPGTYFIDPDRDPSTPLRVTYEVPAEGWKQWTGALKWDDVAKRLDAVAITTVTNLVRDGCRDHSYAKPPVGPSVDDLANGLAHLAPFRVTSRPKDVTIYGYSGKHLELIVPDLPVDHQGFAGCIGGNLNSYVSAIYDDEAFGGYTHPGDREEFWILDVDGTRLVIAAERADGSPSRDLAELQAILDSIRIEPGSDAASTGSILRRAGEVLLFTPTGDGARGDLVAASPDTGEERVLVQDLPVVASASWSADGRWVAYETGAGEDIALWVVSDRQEPRQVATGASILAWSSTGAELATIRLTSPFHSHIAGSTLSTIDAVTGETSDVGSILDGVGDVTSLPEWSPDLTRFVFGARGGAIYSADVRSGVPSLLVRLPGDHLDSVDQIVWSPDGRHIAVMNDGEPGGVYVMAADGSNVRVLLHDRSRLAWSPDGTRLAYRDGSGVVWVASMEGSAPTEIGPLAASCSALFCEGDLVWSPDGSRIALRYPGDDGTVDVWAIHADRQGAVEHISALTYLSWAGGSYGSDSFS